MVFHVNFIYIDINIHNLYILSFLSIICELYICTLILLTFPFLHILPLPLQHPLQKKLNLNANQE